MKIDQLWFHEQVRKFEWLDMVEKYSPNLNILLSYLLLFSLTNKVSIRQAKAILKITLNER